MATATKGKKPVKAPGRAYRRGISLVRAAEMFSDPEFTEQWFVDARWPDGIPCPRCDSKNIQHRTNRKPQPFRCNDCRSDFSVKKGVSSMKLHRDLGVSQKTAWHLAHRIRKAWAADHPLFGGPVEVDGTYVGGKEKDKHRPSTWGATPPSWGAAQRPPPGHNGTDAQPCARARGQAPALRRAYGVERNAPHGHGVCKVGVCPHDRNERSTFVGA